MKSRKMRKTTKTMRMKKSANSIYKKETESLSIIWPILAVLFVLILVVLFKFINMTKRETDADILAHIDDTFQIDIHEASMELTKIMAAGSVAAGMLGDNGVDYAHWDENVDYIYNSVDDIYMVTIIDKDGKGVCSLDNNYIDLKGYDYFRKSDSSYFVAVPNDGLTGTSAIVCVVPIVYEANTYGYVCEYININDFKKAFPMAGNEKSNGVFLLENDGRIILKNGDIIKVNSSNFYDVLSGSSLDRAEIMQIKTNSSASKNQHITAKIGDKDYLVVIMPMEINDWLCVQLIDNDYYNKTVKLKNANEIKVVSQLLILCFVSVLLISYIMLRNRISDARVNKELENKADTDLLTGLNNKIATERKIKETLETEAGTQHLLLLFDVDNFKKINDTMGHAFGDKVIKSLGEQLSQEFRKTDILGRTGGDEFTLLIKDLKDDNVIVKECDKITKFFNDFRVGDYVKYSATASIGAAVYPRDGSSFEDLYKSADKSLYEAKKLGKNRLVYSDKSLLNLADKSKKAYIVQDEEN